MEGLPVLPAHHNMSSGGETHDELTLFGKFLLFNVPSLGVDDILFLVKLFSGTPGIPKHVYDVIRGSLAS